MADRVTIQDIADALGVSRNTVSKAINNTGILADATREKILKKAAEMGYKQFSYLNIASTSGFNIQSGFYPEKEENSGEIALFTEIFLGNSHFATIMLDKFQQEISQLGYYLTIHRVSAENLAQKTLPISFNKKRTSAIMCIELFDYEYSQMVCGLGLPVLFVDTPAFEGRTLPADRLYMDNSSNIYAFVREMVSRGKEKIGFVGAFRHCHSFFERYMAYREAMYLNGLPCPEEYCITGNKEGLRKPSPEDYRNYLEEQIRSIGSLPDVFICANDFVAIDVLNIFKKLGISVPEDIYLCGFDDSPESRILTPPLTTIHIHCQIMGFSAVQLLMSRIKEPSLSFRTVYTETSLIYRESTND